MGIVIHIDTRQLDITPVFFPDRIFLSEEIQTGFFLSWILLKPPEGTNCRFALCTNNHRSKTRFIILGFFWVLWFSKTRFLLSWILLKPSGGTNCRFVLCTNDQRSKTRFLYRDCTRETYVDMSDVRLCKYRDVHQPKTITMLYTHTYIGLVNIWGANSCELGVFRS